jgi:hypothetical protein
MEMLATGTRAALAAYAVGARGGALIGGAVSAAQEGGAHARDNAAPHADGAASSMPAAA